MKTTFTASKVVNDIIAFDKEHKLIQFLINEDQPILHYEDIEKCELTNEYFEKPAYSLLSNMFAYSGILASENQSLRIRIKLTLKNGEHFYGYVSKAVIHPNTTAYCVDQEQGREILKLIRTIIKRQN